MTVHEQIEGALVLTKDEHGALQEFEAFWNTLMAKHDVRMLVYWHAWAMVLSSIMINHKALGAPFEEYAFAFNLMQRMAADMAAAAEADPGNAQAIQRHQLAMAEPAGSA